MTVLSYHVSHEQFSPGDLLGYVRLAEDAGFDAAFSSDHLQPWGTEQGHSAFLWSWLGAALQATRRLPFGAITVPGGWRYHPVITAQAVATLAEMYPGRIPWIALGSGEAINECVVGTGWPAKAERDERLREAASIIRRLLRGETVDHRGLLRAEGARLWTLPAEPVALAGAAMSEAGARNVAGWADALLTTCTDLAQLRRIVTAFREAGGGDKPVHLKVEVSWAASEEAALDQAHRQWRYLMAGRRASQEFRTIGQFESAAASVAPEDIRSSVLVSASLGQHVEWLRERLALGLATLDIHDVGTNQAAFIVAFGREVLPALRAG